MSAAVSIYIYDHTPSGQSRPYKHRKFSVHGTVPYVVFQNIPGYDVLLLYTMCVCVFFPFILNSSSLDVPAGVTQEKDHTVFLIHLLSAVRTFIFLARRIQPFLSPVGREVEFCVLTI